MLAAQYNASSLKTKNSSDLRVLHIAETLTGGPASYLNSLLCGQNKLYRSENIGVLVPEAQAHSLFAAGDNKKFVFTRERRSVAGLQDLRRAIGTALAEFSPDVLHLHSTFAGATTLLSGVPKKIPTVFCPHGWAHDRKSSVPVQLMLVALDRILAHRATLIHCISLHEYVLATQLGVSPKRLSYIPNRIPSAAPTELRSFFNWTDGKLRIAFVGRFDRQKGIDILFNVARELEHQIEFACAGDYVVDRPLFVPALENVHLLGWRTSAEVHALMRSADFVFVPSRWEGFGLVVLEAMRAGTPVIASDVGALRELVRTGCNGMLFRSGSYQDASRLISQLTPQLSELMKRRIPDYYLTHFPYEEMVCGVDRAYLDAQCAHFVGNQT